MGCPSGRPETETLFLARTSTCLGYGGKTKKLQSGGSQYWSRLRVTGDRRRLRRNHGVVPPTAAELAAATPASRDRYVDFLRALSIGIVVLGHWLMAVIVWRNGKIDGTNLLAVVPEAQLLTWLVQVMPLFFFVGGFSNSVTWDALRRRGAGYPEFAYGRVERLVRPVAVLLVVWVPITLSLQVWGVEDSILRDVTRLVVQLLWFLGVYLLVVALSPVMLRLHRRYGIKVPLMLAGLAAAVDVLHRLDLPIVGFVNFVSVWFFAHQLGFFYADGRLGASRRIPLLLCAGGLVSLVLLTTLGPYPTSMVGLPGEPSNMDPPTMCIVALTLWLVGLAMIVRPPVTRWLRRARPWTAVVAMNGVIMTIFLWHISALILTVLIAYPLGFPQPTAGSPAWWGLRIPWYAMLLVCLSILVAVFGRFERPKRREPVLNAPTVARRTAAIVGIGYVFLGVTGFAVSGLAGFVDPKGATLVVLSVNPLLNLLHLALGVALLRRAIDMAEPVSVLLVAAALLAALAVAGLLDSEHRGNVLALDPIDAALHAFTAVALAGVAASTRRRQQVA